MALADNLVEYFPLNEVSGARVGLHAAHSLADNNTVGSATGRSYALAASFVEGANESLTIADNAAFSIGDTDYTIALTFALGSVPAYDFYLLRKWAGNSTLDEYMISKNSTNKAVFNVRDSSNNLNSATSVASLTSATWHTAIVWHDSVNNLIGISLNNATAVTTAHTTGVRDGVQAFAVGGGNSLNGYIGPVVAWNRVLSSGERTTYHNSGTPLTYAAMTAGGVVPGLMRQYRQRRA